MYNPNLNKLVLNIDSSQRILGTSTDFQLNPNLSQYNGAKSVMVQSVEIVNSFYNIPTDSVNFKLRLVKLRNQNRVPQAINPPTTYLIDVNLVAKNYNATSLVQALQNAVNTWCSNNGVLVDTTVQPVIFTVDSDAYRFTISLDPSLTDWGFILPYSSLASNILGFTGLKPDSSFLNINSTNNTLTAVVLSSNVDSKTGEAQSGNVFTNITVVDSSTNQLKFYIRNSSTKNIVGSFFLTLDNGVYGKGPIMTQINSKIAARESELGLSNSVRLYFENNRFVFRNVDNTNNPYELAFIGESAYILGKLGSAQWDGYDFPSSGLSPIYQYGYAHYSNVIAEVVYSGTYSISPGYWTSQSLYDCFPQILQNLFGNGVVSYNLTNKTLTHTAGAPICFITSSNSGKSLFNITEIDLNTMFIKAGNVMPPGVGSVLNNIVLSVPTIPLFNTMISDSVINLRGIDVIYIHSNCSSSLSADGYGNNQRVILKLPVSSPLGYSIQWQNWDNQLYRFPASNTDLLTFSLRDKNGKVLSNQNLDWSITLVYFFDS